MPLQAFSFPLPETRLIKAGNFIYKFKIRGGSSYRTSGLEEKGKHFDIEFQTEVMIQFFKALQNVLQSQKQLGRCLSLSAEDVMGRHSYKQELEEIIRAVLCNLDSLQPFTSTHFNVFPYKKRWEEASKVIHCEKNLKAYPFILILYLEKNTQNSGQQAEDQLSLEQEAAQKMPSDCEPQPKRHKRDSPLEEAMLKALVKDLEAESKISVVRVHGNSPRAWEEARKDPGPADKKGPMGFDEAQQESGVNMVRGSGPPAEVHPGTIQDMDKEEEEEEEGDEEEACQTSVKPGILTRLASRIFPFSLFFREP